LTLLSITVTGLKAVLNFKKIVSSTSRIFQNYTISFPQRRKHDASMLDESELLNKLERHAFPPTGQAMCRYGDPAYPHRVHLQRPFQYGVLTHQMQSFNDSMSKVRTSVEWIFGNIINYFKFLDFKKDLKLDLSPIGKMYIVCALLRNALTCLYGDTTSEFFELDPPSL